MNLKENSYLCFPKASATVITVVRNTEQFIVEAIDSVINQTYTDWHYIVIDDDSTDKTYEIASAHAAANEKITVLKRGKKHVNVHVNEALKNSSSTFVAFLDGDDMWDATKLAVQIESMADADVLGSMVNLTEFGQSSDGKFVARPGEVPGFGRTAFMCKRSLFDALGYFDENLSFGDFIEWYTRVQRAEIKIAKVGTSLGRRRVHDNNMTTRVEGSDYLKLLRQHMLLKRKG